MSSSLPLSGLLLWILLMLLLCFLVLLALLCSGMNKATRKARRTAHAPNRKGGPGIMELCSGVGGGGEKREISHHRRISEIKSALQNCIQVIYGHLQMLPR